MAGELVMRSLRLTKDEDQELRRLAWEAKVPIGELIRAAVASRVGDWEADTTDGLLEADLAAIQRSTSGR
jgi:hypothetical protein